MIKTYIDKIGESKDIKKMEELGEMLEELIYGLKESHHEEYEEYKEELYELAYGKKLNIDMAVEWVNNMKPIGEHWTLDQTTSAKESLGYNVDNVDFYIVANMMYNDYFDLVRDDETLALKLARDWLDDSDAKKDKLYCYWKHVVEK